MKYKDWLGQQYKGNSTLPDPIRGNPIKCPDCGETVGYEKDYMFMVIQHPIVCPKCDEIVIMPNNGITY